MLDTHLFSRHFNVAIMNYIKSKRKFRKLLLFLNKLACSNNLLLSDKEMLGDKIVAIDKMQKKLLVASKSDDGYQSQIVHLSEIKSCKIKKTYSGIQAVHFKKNKVDEYLKSIMILFDFSNHKVPLVLEFCKGKGYSLRDMQRLSETTKQWQEKLSDMLTNERKQAA